MMRRVRCAAAAMVAVLLAGGAAAETGRPEGFVDASAHVPGLVLDLRYTGPDNFVGQPIDGYERPVCLLTEPAARALARAQADLARRGLRLKVFDCYRPQRAVAHFVRWSRDPADTRTKPAYYPELEKADLFAEGYIAERSGHSRGSTVDATLVQRDGRALDMGGPFDFFGPLSWSDSRLVGKRQRANRRLLRTAMQRAGFRPYDKEWWHFTLQNEPFPDRYFDFSVR